MTGLPRLILARRKDRALSELAKHLGGRAYVLREGSRDRAAKATCPGAGEGRLPETVYLAWGFCPSPLALRVLDSFLDLYDGPKSKPSPPPTRVFYVCYAGTHSSILASYLHLGKMKAKMAATSLSPSDSQGNRRSGKMFRPVGAQGTRGNRMAIEE